ncbi:MAG: aspartyl protease family protein [Bacteroidales bacterium]|nr:aspartyl protease family protein [Bacteroidales bacterium]
MAKIFVKFFLMIACVFINQESFTQNPLKRFEFANPRQKSLKIPFKFINNLIVIPAAINNSDTLNFILDTGISTTMITELTDVDSLVLNFAREIELRGLGTGEPLKGLHSYGNEIKIKKIIGQNQDIYVISDDVFHLSSRMGLPIQGILGYSIFSNFIVSINYDTKTISFEKPETFNYKKKLSHYFELPIEINDTKPYITINIIDDKGISYPVKLLMDTGASHAIWLDQSSMQNMGLPPGSKETYLGTGLNGEVFGYLGRMACVDFFEAQLKNVIVSFPDSSSIANAAGLNGRNGSIGSELLKRFNIIIDYPHQKIFLNPNSYFKNEFIQNLSGMEVIAPYPGLRIFTIEGIRKDSPADRAGLMKGDVIKSINGLKSEKLDLSDIYLLLQQHPGRKMLVIYMRDGVLLETSFVLEEFI